MLRYRDSSTVATIRRVLIRSNVMCCVDLYGPVSMACLNVDGTLTTHLDHMIEDIEKNLPQYGSINRNTRKVRGNSGCESNTMCLGVARNGHKYTIQSFGD